VCNHFSHLCRQDEVKLAPNPEGESIQVVSFQLYNASLTPLANASLLLAPADIIQNVDVVSYPSAQALLQGPPQKFGLKPQVRKQAKLLN
jgi:hypothetical protein